MSASDEDTELKELVIQALENNGVLAKIRAQLRASVFLALDEANSLQKNKPLANKELQDYLSTKNGKYVAYLVHNFLKHFNLDSTLSVYEPESYHGQMYSSDEHDALVGDLVINPEDNRMPLLDTLVQKCMGHEQKSISNESRAAPAPAAPLSLVTEDRVIEPPAPSAGKTTERSVGEGQEAPPEATTTISNNEEDDDDFFDDPPAAESKSPVRRSLDTTTTTAAAAKKSEWDGAGALSSGRPLKSLTDGIGGGAGGLKPASLTSDSAKLDATFSGSILGSLRGAPPLTDIKAKLPPLNLWKEDPSPITKNNQKSDVPAPYSDYDEDFNSSASNRSDQKTGTELSIEEDIEEQSLRIDDLLSNEATSEAEDATTDNTVSRISATGVDYLESID